MGRISCICPSLCIISHHLQVMLLDHLLEQDPLGPVAADQEVHGERAVGAELPCADPGDGGHHEIDALPVDEAAADRHDYPLESRKNKILLALFVFSMCIYDYVSLISEWS